MNNLSSFSLKSFSLDRTFTWNLHSDIVQLLLFAESTRSILTNVLKIRPINGTQLIYPKSLMSKVRNSDGYIWQKKKERKTARENQMLFKVNGVECLLAKYSKSAILPSFQRRCYCLKQNPEIVFVHYLNVPSLTTDYKVAIPRSTLLESDLANTNEITLFEQLTAMFDSFPSSITKSGVETTVNLDTQMIIRSIVEQIMFYKINRYYPQSLPDRNAQISFTSDINNHHHHQQQHNLLHNNKQNNHQVPANRIYSANDMKLANRKSMDSSSSQISSNNISRSSISSDGVINTSRHLPPKSVQSNRRNYRGELLSNQSDRCGNVPVVSNVSVAIDNNNSSSSSSMDIANHSSIYSTIGNRQSDSCLATALSNTGGGNNVLFPSNSTRHLPTERFFHRANNIDNYGNNKKVFVKINNTTNTITSYNNNNNNNNNNNSCIDSQPQLSNVDNSMESSEPTYDQYLAFDNQNNLSEIDYWGDIEGSVDQVEQLQFSPKHGQEVEQSPYLSSVGQEVEQLQFSPKHGHEAVFNLEELDCDDSDLLSLMMLSDEPPTLAAGQFSGLSINHYAPCWAPTQGGGDILIVVSGLDSDHCRLHHCSVLFGQVASPACLIQQGLLKAQIPAQAQSGQVPLRIQIADQISLPLIMFNYEDVGAVDTSVLVVPLSNEQDGLCAMLEDVELHQSINTWVFQRDAQLKVAIVELMSLLEEKIMRFPVNTSSKLEVKSDEFNQSISCEMIRVRKWCCSDSLELVLARCCFTWCQRATNPLLGSICSNQINHEGGVNEGPMKVEIPLLHIAAGLGYLEFARLLLVWYLLHIRQISHHITRLDQSTNNNGEFSQQIKLQKSLIDLIIGQGNVSGSISDSGSYDSRGLTALLWACIKNSNVQITRLLAMWNPELINSLLPRYSINTIKLLEKLGLGDQAVLLGEISTWYVGNDEEDNDESDRHHISDNDDALPSITANQINALWDCLGRANQDELYSEFENDLSEFEDIIRLGAGSVPPMVVTAHNGVSSDDLSLAESPLGSSWALDNESMSLGETAGHLDGVDKNEYQMLCLAGRIIKAMPNRIKQSTTSSSNNDRSSGSPTNDINLPNGGTEPSTATINSSAASQSHFRPLFASCRDRSYSYSSFSSSSNNECLSNSGLTSAPLHGGTFLRRRSSRPDDSGISTPFDDSTNPVLSDHNSNNKSSFQIDSPPPTAEEIADHFNAPSCFMEADFSRLTLSDREQKRLYEAAQLIQKCYRAYRRKTNNQPNSGSCSGGGPGRCDISEPPSCKKLLLHSGIPVQHAVVLTAAQMTTQNNVTAATAAKPPHAPARVCSKRNGDLAAVVATGSHATELVVNDHLTSNTTSNTNTPSITASTGEYQKKIEAAIIIQSYYRRYKQYAYYKKMCQAAVLIQNQFRWYVEHKRNLTQSSLAQSFTNRSNSISGGRPYKLINGTKFSRNSTMKNRHNLPNTLGAAYGVLRSLLTSKCHGINNYGPCLLPTAANQSKLNTNNLLSSHWSKYNQQ